VEVPVRVLPSLLVVVFLVACGPSEREAAPLPGPTIADFAGTWESMVTLEGVDDPVPSRMMGSEDGTDWALLVEGRDPIALRVSMSGDSLVAESEEYESILRPGVATRVRTAGVLVNGRLVGNVTVTYQTPAGAEVVRGTIQGTRVP
jgi:hypothetical protein